MMMRFTLTFILSMYWVKIASLATASESLATTNLPTSDEPADSAIDPILLEEVTNDVNKLKSDINGAIATVHDVINSFSKLPIILDTGDHLPAEKDHTGTDTETVQNHDGTHAGARYSSTSNQNHAGDHGSTSFSNETCRGGIACIHGLLLPLWHPTPPDAPLEDRITFAIAFIMCMVYLFIGIGMASDIFAGAIEKITSQKRRVKVRSRSEPDKFEYIQVPVWNRIVAHLSLGAFASSAAEIFLSFIETCINFTAGQLGPGTIVGAGAYNLFIIQAVCIASVKNGKSKRIRDLRIYFVTAFFALFAYLWLYIILVPSSPGVVEIWEAILTMCFFPIMVCTGYAVDTKLFGLCSKKRKAITPAIQVNGELAMTSSTTSPAPSSINSDDPIVEQSRESMGKVEQRYLEIAEEVRAKRPNLPSEEVQKLAAVQLLKEMPKGHGYYRMQTSRGITGGGDVISAEKLQNLLDHQEKQRIRREMTSDETSQVIVFDPDVYQVMENVGVFYVNVARRGAGLDYTIATVEYATKDGSAKAGIDYDTIKGTLVFNKGERLKTIPIHVIDDDEFTNDCEFFVLLSDPKLILQTSYGHTLKLKLGEKQYATVKKMDDDQGGHFHFGNDRLTIEENCGETELKILRSAGVKGRVEVPFRITPITALPYVHYEMENDTQQVVVFEPRQTEQTIKLKITNEGKLKKENVFKIDLGEPQWSSKQTLRPGSRKKPHRRSHHGSRLSSAFKYEVDSISRRGVDVDNDDNDDDDEIGRIVDTAKLGRPRLETPSTLTVTICESRQLRATLDEIVAMSDNVGELVATTTWREQFQSAVKLRGDIDPDTGTEMEPRLKNYVVHFSLFFWKILFATIPPVHFAMGWLAFFVCLFYIGLMAAILGDLASQLGCTIGLRNEITAITFVALGSSLPDMFASRLAAIKEETADAAIGGANGAVALNVYMGLGLSWTVAAIYQNAHGRQLTVPAGSLTFSFTIFLSFATAGIVVVLLRRLAPVHGELGGPPVIKYLTVIFLVLLWALYVILSALDNYCIIKSF